VKPNKAFHQQLNQLATTLNTRRAAAQLSIQQLTMTDNLTRVEWLFNHYVESLGFELDFQVG
jgi:hypothetical protein